MKPDPNIINELKGTDWTYREVAEAHGIDPDRFEKLMVLRFDSGTPENPENEGKDFHLSYTCEWAMRVKKGVHWNAADPETERILEKVGYERGDE